MRSPLLLAKSFAVYCSGQKLVLSRTRLALNTKGNALLQQSAFRGKETASAACSGQNFPSLCRAATSCWMPEELKRLLCAWCLPQNQFGRPAQCARPFCRPEAIGITSCMAGSLRACSHAECLSKSNESGAAQNQFLAAAIDCK